MKALAFLALVGLAVASHADPVDDLVTRALEGGTPGIAIAVIKDGKVEQLKGYGFADLENQVRVTPDSIFQIGSVTKQFTSTLIMMLVEEGKVVLDAPISTYLSDLPESWRDATVRQLLHHSSGIPSYTDLPAFGGKMRLPGTDKDLIALAASVPNPFKHGEKWSYNNTAYYLLGMVVEKLTGKSFDAALRDRICTPAGLKSTRMNTWDALIPNRARGYTGKPGSIKNADFLDMVWPGAAGAMVSNVRDLSAWLLLQGSPRLLKSSSWASMTTNGFPIGDGDTYGFGWSLSKVNGHAVVEHGGGIPGFGTYVLRVPGKNFAVAVLTNSDDANPKGLAYRIAEHFHKDLIKKVEGIQDPTPELTKRLRAVFEQAMKGTMNEADFGEPLKSVIFPKNQMMLRDMLGPNAKLETFTLSETSEANKVVNRIYLAKIGDATLKLSFQVAEDGKIVGLFVQNG